MQVVKPTIKEIIFSKPENGMTPEQLIEMAGRTCYKSENRITEDSSEKFVRMVRNRSHHAMLEFGTATMIISADRGLTHELVRHRLCSFAQESTRYCNYSKGKFQSEITVVEQPTISKNPIAEEMWFNAMRHAEQYYLALVKEGVPAQEARSVLPIGLKSEIVIQANLREWRHIFIMRCAPAAHPIIQGIMIEALRRFNEKMPSLYEDLAEKFLD